MNTRYMRPKQRVKTSPSDSKGLLADDRYMRNRQEGIGFITDTFSPVVVPMGDSAAWVKHDDGTLAPYWYYELEDL